jgi:hypothetical protein
MSTSIRERSARTSRCTAGSSIDQSSGRETHPARQDAHVDSPARGEQRPQLSPALRRLSVIDRRKGNESGQDARSIERKSFASAVLHGDTAIE